jgi:hypothetical protein
LSSASVTETVEVSLGADCVVVAVVVPESVFATVVMSSRFESVVGKHAACHLYASVVLT